MEGPLGPARVHRATPLGHPRPDRARAPGARHRARICGRRPQHGGLPAESGQITGLGIYTNAEATTAPWIIETSLMTDWVILNPSEEELARLHAAGFRSTEVTNPAEVFQEDSGAEKAILLPFHYGFHVGLEVPEEDVYRMFQIIEENAAELAKADAGFAQIAEDMAGMQVRGVEAAGDLVPTIRALPDLCARKASGTRNGIPRSQRNSRPLGRSGARAADGPRPASAPTTRSQRADDVRGYASPAAPPGGRGPAPSRCFHLLRRKAVPVLRRRLGRADAARRDPGSDHLCPVHA